MKKASSGSPAPALKTADLRLRLAEAEEALRAIRAGEVDAVVVAGKHGPQVFTLEGEEHAYRVLIESMNEGALALTADKTILYANQCFARMVNCPLEKVTGGSLSRFLSSEDRALLRPRLKRPGKTGFKIQAILHGSDGSRMPVHISIRPLVNNGSKSATLGMVVTDMTEAHKAEESLRALTHRVVQVQEAERGRVAHELHDTITQSLCGVLIHSQVLANGLSVRDGTSKDAALKLSGMIGRTVDEVERISRNLRPSILENLGLIAGLRALGAEFEERTGVPVQVTCAILSARLPADTELALYRILQETLRNAEKHAGARRVAVDLMEKKDAVRLSIRDDGTGFDPEHLPARRKTKGKAKGGFGLIGMRERAAAVGGDFRLKSARGHGTEVEVRVPLPGL